MAEKPQFGGSSVFVSSFNTGRSIGSVAPAATAATAAAPAKADVAAQQAAAPGMAVTPDWHRWVAENVLLRNSPPSIVEAMVKAGFNRTVAAREVQAAMNHPYVKAASQLGVGAKGQPAAPQTTARADKFAWFLENQRRAARQGSHFGQIPRVKKPSRQAFLDDFYSQNRPCVIEGAMDDWPAMTRWTGEYLKQRCGDRVVEVQANRNSDANYELNQTKLKKEMTFGEFVDIVESGVETNDFYITANNSGKNKLALKDLWDDIVLFPDYLRGDNPNDNGFFWYGPAGTVTPLHHDLTNNFMAQVRGRKRIKLIAPHDSADVYNNRHCYSPVNPEHPDLAAFPKFANVNVIDLVIGPGDLFFLPVGWWHHVRGLDISITMTFTNFVFDNDFFSFYTTYNDI